MGKIEITYQPVEALIPYVNNSRTHSDEQVAQVAASIQKFGFTNPILVDGEKGIIAGHGRLLAARKLDMKEVPTIELAGLSDAEKKQYIIADNKLALNAGWDYDMLKLELTDLKEMGEDLKIIGFSDSELAELLTDDEKQGETGDNEAPEPPEVATSSPGDVWVLGAHRVMCGDSTKADDLEKLMDGSLADQLITDPPYNVDYESGSGMKLDNDNMEDGDFAQLLNDAMTSAFMALKPGAVIYIWHSDFEADKFIRACRSSGFKVTQCVIWLKDQFVMGRKDYQVKHEHCLYGWKEGAAHLWAADRKQSSVIEVKRPTANKLHPTMKPVELITYQIKNNTKGGDMVLDLFGGSGTTLIAAEKTSRIARLMELDPKYVDVIVERWQDWTGQSAILEGTEQTFNETKAMGSAA